MAEIRQLAEDVGGVAGLLSKRSPKYAGYAAEAHDEAGWIQALAAEPRLLRRPIWHGPKGWEVGFDPARWAAQLID